MTSEDDPATGTTVVVVEDHALVRDSVSRALESAGCVVVASAADPDDALTQLRLHEPDLLLVDVDLGSDRDGLDVASAALEHLTDLRVVVVSMHDDDRTIRRAMSLGVDGFVTKDAPLAELLGAVEAVADGGSYLSSRLASRVMAIAGGQTQDDAAQLTKREREILELLAQGERPTEIADALFVAPKTVKNHLTNVYAKLGVQTAAQAVAEAYRRGLVSSD